MKQLHNIVAPLILFCLMAAVSLPVLAQEQEGEAVSQQTQDEITPKEEQENKVDVKEIVFGHIGDSYEWHITMMSNNTLLNSKANVTFVMEISHGRTCSPATLYSTSLPSYLLPSGAMESPS